MDDVVGRTLVIGSEAVLGLGHNRRDVRDGNHVVLRDPVGREIRLEVAMALTPLPTRTIRTANQHPNRRNRNHPKRHHKRHPLRHRRRKTLLRDKRIENSRHEKIRDAAAGIPQPGRASIGGADDVGVEAGGRPDLAGDKGAAEDADEEAEGEEGGDGGDGAG